MKIRVGILYGGRSVEHEVSIISALQAINAIDKSKYSIVPIYISKNEMWYTGDALLDIDNYKDIDLLTARCQRIVIANTPGEKSILRFPPRFFGKQVLEVLDVAFPILHGTNGEDGTLQGYLESIDIPYVGCNVTASALGMDKIFMKKVLKESGLPVLDFVWFYAKSWLKDNGPLIKTIEEKLSYPLIVKPANLGSSVGVTRAANRFELEEAINLAARFSNRVLVEEMVVNLKEINCSVLGDYERVEASVCEEPISSAEILSYQDKYLADSSKGMGGTARRLPADIPEEMSGLIQDLAKQTFLALGCSGVSRVDFLVDTGIDKVYVNEINTIPGSLAFYLWEASGKAFSRLLDELIQLALKTSREKNELIFSYEANVLAMGGLKGQGIKK